MVYCIKTQSVCPASTERNQCMKSLCDGWEFVSEWSDSFLNGDGEYDIVRLPHNVRELPLHYASPADYEMICGYRRHLSIPAEDAGKRLFLCFDGAAHIATVYLNGKEIGTHRCGYTGFRYEITGCVRYGADNLIAVRLDTTENGSVPPFGFVIDYLTYGGLYREAWLDERAATYLSDVFVSTPDLCTAHVACTVDGPDPVRIRVRILNRNGKNVAESMNSGLVHTLPVPDALSWTPESPNLYTAEVSLLNASDAVIDTKSVRFGFRTAEFRGDGLYLNGKKYFLRGLNRHQCYPYIGYAASRSLQIEDARILKEELSCNAVRTSHYPQSQHFFDACDSLGLCVFTEIPGWQHIGDADWQDQAVDNVREMILENRSHPSIVLWGVRINESVDNDAFYQRTNALAHELDPSRQTSGVRYIQKSSLLEDVYAYNDFTPFDPKKPIQAKKDSSPDMNKGYLISEHDGHMFPTKPFDPWEKRQSQALRHAYVLNAAMSSGEHAGCFGWCMFDYPTHKDFGSGDRICYHGVLDSFRNPKLAAAPYASQGESSPVLVIGSPMDGGDYAAANIGEVYAFTNADSVRLYKNDALVTEFRPLSWSGLVHPPVLIDDLIGNLLESQEGYTGRKAKLLHDCLVAAGKYGVAGLPLRDKIKLGWCMLRYRMKYEDGVRLFGKYVGNWGAESTRWRFDAIKEGETVASTVVTPNNVLHLELKPSLTELIEGDTYDTSAVRIRVLDENGNPAPYAQIPLKLTLTGDAELLCPNLIVAEGGCSGLYLRSIGKTGEADLTVSSPGLKEQTIHFTIHH